MSDGLLEIVPADRREIARAALAAAVGAAPLVELQPVRGGASGALTYRAVAGDRRLLLRLEVGRDRFRDPHRSFACMRAAADAGVAPPLFHADPEAGAAVMAFVPERPLDQFPGGPEALVRDLGGLVSRLQATPEFPPFGEYAVMLERMVGFLAGSSLFAPGLLAPHVEGFRRVREAYPWEAGELVSAHNDPNPRNILYDGERLWLVDWELAFRNDPLADLAILADNFAQTPALEEALLESWLGRAPDRRLRARLTLMRSMTRLFYACIILSGFAMAPRAAPEPDLAAPTPEEFRLMVADGRIAPGAPETLYIFGKMFLAGFLAGLAEPGFEEALAVAAGG
jgi:aminoglycoside phosphotransferase (APT) family kinase protein